MARGNIAKTNIIKKLMSTFGDDWIGEYEKKAYVWANDGGERVQIAISLTCPKNPIQINKDIQINMGDYDFSDDAPINTLVAVDEAAPAEITDEEKENLRLLMEKLGL